MRTHFLLVILTSCAFLATIETVPADPAVGWRMDGSGRYPAATPPVTWSATTNVVWKTELPGRSYASPIVVGDRIFVVSDPSQLLCIRATDGEVLWQRTIDHQALLGAQQAERVLAEFNVFEEQKRELRHEYNALRKQDAATQERLETLKARIAVIEDKIKDLAQPNPPPIDKGGAGNSAATPVFDGKHVYVVFGTGIAAAYSRDGERRWVKFIESTDIGFGHANTPTVVADKLIVHLKDLVALNNTNGEEVWRTELRARHASAIPIRVGNQHLLASPAGAIVRVDDGKILALPRELIVSESSPVLEDEVLFVQSGRTSALRLPVTSDEPFSLGVIWEGKTSRGRRTPSPAYCDGLLYGVTTDGILDVTDAKTGETVYQKRLDIGKVYSSVTIAGDLIYLSGTNGTTIVLRPGRKYDEVARNELESFGSCPVFVGNRMYVRAQKHLYCIADDTRNDGE